MKFSGVAGRRGKNAYALDTRLPLQRWRGSPQPDAIREQLTFSTKAVEMNVSAYIWSLKMKKIIVSNPAEPECTVWSGSETDISTLTDLLARGKRAQKQWSVLTSRQRHEAVSQFLYSIENRSEEIAERMILEQGKLSGEAKGEVAKALVEARWILESSLGSTGEIMASVRKDVRAIKLRRPRGLILAITPWNFPILTPMRKIIPALAFGNAIVIKPSSDAPGAATILAEIASETLPEDIINVIYGGAEVATAAIRSEYVDAVTFTGSTTVGKKVMATASEGLKEVSLELGGKNASILHSPKDLDIALDQIVKSAFANAGQRCTAISRVLAHEQLREKVTEGLRSRIEALKPGSGKNKMSTLAPLSTRNQFESVISFVNSLDQTQARVITGGSVAELPGGGYFYQPTLIEVLESSCPLNSEEIFGPVLGIEFYENIEDAIKKANATPYGLTASIFASEIGEVRKFEEELEVGMLHINHGTFPDENMPFGGWKASGVGAPSVGKEAEQFFTRVQAVYEGC